MDTIIATTESNLASVPINDCSDETLDPIGNTNAIANRADSIADDQMFIPESIYTPSGMTFVKSYTYRNFDSTISGHSCLYRSNQNPERTKKVIFFGKIHSIWMEMGKATPFQLDLIGKHPDRPILFVQSEDIALRLTAVGRLASTVAEDLDPDPFNRDKPKTDLSACSGKQLIILHDNTPEGWKFLKLISARISAMDAPPQYCRVDVDSMQSETPFTWNQWLDDNPAPTDETFTCLPTIEPDDVGYDSPIDEESIGNTFQELMAIVPDPKANILGDGLLVRNSINLLFGASESGKSTFLFQLAVSLSKGIDFLGMKVHHPVRVLYCSAEGSPDQSVQRFRTAVNAMNVEPNKNLRIMLGSEIPDAQDQLEMLDLIKRGRFDVLILDPYSYFFQGLKEENSNTLVKQNIIFPAWELCQETGVAIILSHHASKSSGATPGKGQIRGASAFESDCTTVIQLSARAGKVSAVNCLPRELNFVKTKHSMKGQPPIKLEFDQEHAIFKLAGVSAGTQGVELDEVHAPHPQLSAVVSAVRKHGHVKPGVLYAELMKMLNLKKRQVEVLVARARSCNLIIKNEAGDFMLSEVSNISL